MGIGEQRKMVQVPDLGIATHEGHIAYLFSLNFNFLFLQSRYRRWLERIAEPRLDARGERIGCRNH